MKKKLLWPLLALSLGACSDNNNVNPSNPEVAGGESVSKFLSLNVFSALGTRAESDYQNGTAAENQVTQVRFFFFDEDGKAFPVWENKGTSGGNYNSYLDWFPNATDETDATPGGSNSLQQNQTVESILNTTLSLMVPASYQEGQPSAVIAVLNPPASVLSLNPSATVDTGATSITVNGPSLETIRETVSDYRTGFMSPGTFVMSNSVYVNTGKVVDATIITEDNFGANEAEAEADPITIYVERVLSRLDFVLSLENKSLVLSDGTTIYELGDYSVYNGTNTSEGETEKIYVKLLGWNVTGVANSSRLVKSVDSGWTNTSLFGSDQIVWNSSDYHRSFWALNPNPDTSSFDYLFGNFNGTASTTNPFPAMANQIVKGTSTYSTYLQENANNYNVGTNGVINPEGPEYASDVIIAAQLVDNQGNPYPMCEWNYYKYTFPQLQAKLISTVFSNLRIRTGSEGSYTFRTISPQDFTFATATQAGIVEEDEANYYVYPVVSTSATNLTWTMGEGATASVMTIAEVNTFMRDAINHVMVWNNGMTYYFFPVQHLGTEESPAYYGIVRNHIYLCTLRSLKGLGTPVYDQSETIYPEKTQSEDNIVTAAVRILQWRIVAQSYDLEW